MNRRTIGQQDTDARTRWEVEREKRAPNAMRRRVVLQPRDRIAGAQEGRRRGPALRPVANPLGERPALSVLSARARHAGYCPLCKPTMRRTSLTP